MGQVTSPGSRTDRVARFEQLFRATRTEILAYLLRRTSRPEDAADVLSDVYLTAWRRFEDLPTGAETRLWLYGTARRTLANHRRREKSTAGIAQKLRDELRVGQYGSRATGVSDPTVIAVHEALQRLEPNARELLTLSAWEELTPNEIAIMTGELPGTIRVRLHRARARLKTELEQGGAYDDEPFDLLAIGCPGLVRVEHEPTEHIPN